MLELTNTQEALKFAGFIMEALECVDEWTPTEINSGGCGIFAAYLYDELEKIGLSSEIYACYGRDEKEAEEGINQFLKTGNLNREAGVGHVLVKVGEIYLDSKGIVNFKAIHSVSKIVITRDQLQTLNDNVASWNSEFDRSCNDFIKQKMDEVFSKYSTFKSGSLPMPKPREVKLTEHTVQEKRRHFDPFDIMGMMS